MDQQNPYAAPQTISLESMEAVPPALPLGDTSDLQAMIRGANVCHDAFMTLVSMLVVSFLMAFVKIHWLVAAWGYISLIMVLSACGLHLYGLFKLRQAPPASGASWLFTTSIVLFVLSICNILAWLLALFEIKTPELLLWPMLSYLLLRATSFAALLGGLQRIGTYVQVSKANRWSQFTLALLGYVTLVELVFYSPGSFSIIYRFADEAIPPLMWLLISSYIVALVLMLIFYVLTLKNVMQLEQLLPGNNTSLPLATEYPTGEAALNDV